MDATVKMMEAQLGRWKAKIDNLAARAPVPSGQTRFDAQLYIDELKALHAIAQTRFDDFKAATAPERTRCEAEFRSAWHELDGAFRNPGLRGRPAQHRKR